MVRTWTFCVSRRLGVMPITYVALVSKPASVRTLDDCVELDVQARWKKECRHCIGGWSPTTRQVECTYCLPSSCTSFGHALADLRRATGPSLARCSGRTAATTIPGNAAAGLQPMTDKIMLGGGTAGSAMHLFMRSRVCFKAQQEWRSLSTGDTRDRH